jgi:hypothetical protein
MNERLPWPTVIVPGVLAAVAALAWAMHLVQHEEGMVRTLTVADAAAVLEVAKEHVRSGDMEALCDLARHRSGPDEICLREVETDPPQDSVLDARVLDTRTMIDAERGDAAGIVLELCVPTAAGDLYTEFIVQRRLSELHVPYPTFWLHRIIVAGAPVDGYYSTGPGSTRREC